MNIIVLVGKDENGLWNYTCPDVPSLKGQARDRATISRLAGEQVGAYVRGLAGARRILPSPRSLDQLRQDAGFQAAQKSGAEIEVVSTRI